MSDDARVTSRVALAEETQVERQLRPQRLDEYVGQKVAVESLRVSVEAARQRGEPLDHVLLSGPPGLGKTTLAAIMANEMGASIAITAGPSLERGADLMGILTNVGERDVLFIDEIHRLPRTVEELLYPAMEDLDQLRDGQGAQRPDYADPLRPFTLVGATTRPGMLSSPLRERFGIFHHLDFYSVKDLCSIICAPRRSSAPPSSPRGRRPSRGARAGPRASPTDCCAGCATTARSRAMGWSPPPRRATRSTARASTTPASIASIAASWSPSSAVSGGPVGLEAIAATINDEAETLAEVVEPFLLKIGYVVRSPNGRKATAAAYTHLGYGAPAPESSQGQLPL